MRLTRVFMLTTGLLLALVAAMLARNLMQEWSTLKSSADGLHAMEVAYQAMQAAEKASFERGPANGVLGDGDAPDPAKRERLAAARRATDEAFAKVFTSLDGATHPDLTAALSRMRAAEEQLRAARGEVLRIAAMPRALRPPAEVTAAVNEMFRVVDILMEAITLLSRQAARIHPELTDALVGARMAAELREHAGRLGSQFTAALTGNKPLTAAEQRNILLLQGRIEQLWRLILVRHSAGTDPRIAAAIAETRSRYFDTGLPFVAEVQAAGAAGRGYGMDTAGFAQRYVPEMKSIVQLRDAMVAVARDAGRAGHQASRDNLAWNASIGLAVLLIEVAVFLFIRRRVLKPLLAATGTLTAIARGELDTPAAATRRHDEIGDMQDAVRVLRDESLAKRRLEVERERLIAELSTASRIDFLTGLLNRRAFTEVVNQQLATARRQQWPVALILFDIDHFKAVNDAHGHDAGDMVLQEVAAIARRAFRAADSVARFGGEEFVALAMDCGREHAEALVERLRSAIAAHLFQDSMGKAFGVTASFGLLMVHPGSAEAPDLDALFVRVDRALYAAKREGRNRVEMA